jgi:16S rRNA (cytosine1402-N4)-methyltransferase
MAHVSVLLNEATEALAIHPDGVYVDCTYGRGGHSAEILKKLGAKGRLLAFDKDPQAVANARERWKDEPRFELIHASFAELAEQMQARELSEKIDGVLMDLGVSSPQLDDASRGFSFMQDGPLDMRMNNQAGLSARDWLKATSQDAIAEALKLYGDEKFAGRIARVIKEALAEDKLYTTLELAECVAKVVPIKEKNKHPATRTFQAIRIAVNNELGDLEQVLAQSLMVLKPGGRLAAISFHSLEDRMVKRFMKTQSQGSQVPKEIPIQEIAGDCPLRQVFKPVFPSEAEVEMNPRARSAVLRVGVKA